MSFNEWKDIELQEVTENYNTLRKPLSSKQRAIKQGIYNYYGAQGVIDYIDEYMLEGEYLLIAEDGANLETRNEDIARLTKKDEKFWVNNHAHVIRSNDKSDIRYIKYALNSMDISAYITGSAQPKLNKNNLNRIRLILPQIEEQKAIAKILSDLDNKIEVNNKINQRLEDMAQSIFKHWFVDFEFPNEEGNPYKSSGGEMVESELGMIPKGWEVSQLKELIQNIKNSTKAGDHLKELKYVPIDSMSMKCVTLNNYKSYEEAKSSLILFDKYDILIGAMRVYFHRVNLAPFKGITRTTTFVLRPYNSYDVSYALFLMNLESTINYANQGSKGSTMPYAVWDNGLDSMKFILPCDDLRRKFNEIIIPILDKMMKLSTENERLSNLRDTLLPKLMSGEIRVPINKEI